MNVASDWRTKLVLKRFQERDVLRYCDLPAGVGHKTMALLVEQGVVRVVAEPRGEERRTGGAWQLLGGAHSSVALL